MGEGRSLHGYVLKSQMKELLEEQAAIANRDMTEVIEEERQKVDAKTPITEEVRTGGTVSDCRMCSVYVWDVCGKRMERASTVVQEKPDRNTGCLYV